jgi:hypothetical protein
MIDVQYVKALLGTTVDKLAKFDYSKLVPKFRSEKYAYGVAGIEFTLPWKKEGLGIGVGLGVLDFWFGWPKDDGPLHYEGCLHEKPVKVPEPVGS